MACQPWTIGGLHRLAMLIAMVILVARYNVYNIFKYWVSTSSFIWLNWVGPDPTIATAIARDDGLINRVARYKGLTCFARLHHNGDDLSQGVASVPWELLGIGRESTYFILRHVLFLYSGSLLLGIYLY